MKWFEICLLAMGLFVLVCAAAGIGFSAVVFFIFAGRMAMTLALLMALVLAAVVVNLWRHEDGD